MSLYGLVAFGVMAYTAFDDVCKKAYGLFVKRLKLFPDARHNEVVKWLNRYEGLLIECLRIFRLEGQVIVDSKPLKTKRLVRYSRHGKRGSKLIREGIGFNPLKGFYVGYKPTCATDGKHPSLLYVDQANKHDLIMNSALWLNYVPLINPTLNTSR